MQEHKDQRRAVFQFYDNGKTLVNETKSMDALYEQFKSWCATSPDHNIAHHRIINRYQFRTWIRQFNNPQLCKGDYEKLKKKYV